MASCKAVFENINLAACAIPAHAWTAAMHAYHSFLGDDPRMLYYLTFHISQEHETQFISQGHSTMEDKGEAPQPAERET